MKTLILTLLLSVSCFAGTPFSQTSNNVATAGTAERISSADLTVLGAIIQAKPGNTGNIFIGDSSVSSSVYGVVLDAGESLNLSMDVAKPGSAGFNLYDMYIDTDNSTDGVTVLYFTK